MRGWSWALGCAALVVAPRLARADAASCVAAAERAQSALEQKKLVETQATASACAAKDCPDVVRADCARWLKQARRELASAVVRVIDRTGTEIADARVTFDGAGIHREVAAGELLELDPGDYTITYGRGASRADKPVTLTAGEKNREVVVLVETTAPENGLRAQSQAPVWPWPWIAGGVAVVGLATFGLLQASSASKFDSLEQRCGQKGAGCPEEEIDGVRRQVVASGVGLGVGVVAGAAAIVLFMMEPKAARSKQTWTLPRLTPRAGGGGVVFAF